MARNKYPEETIKHILDVSLKLFLEKGTENTSIQDIINELGGLSKGAIYHHFHSKDEIIKAVITNLHKDRYSKWMEIISKKSSLTGLEKLKELLRTSLENSSRIDSVIFAPGLLEDSKMLAFEMNSIFVESVLVYLQPVIEQGIQDGSIRTDFPKELAEVISILTSLWLTPRAFDIDEESMKNGILFFNQLLLGLGINLVDDQIMKQYEQFCNLYNKK